MTRGLSARIFREMLAGSSVSAGGMRPSCGGVGRESSEGRWERGVIHRDNRVQGRGVGWGKVGVTYRDSHPSSTRLPQLELRSY